MGKGIVVPIDNPEKAVKASNCILSTGNTVEQAINRGSVKVTANGVKTYSQVLNDLFALIDMTKITANSCFIIAYNNTANSNLYFSLAESTNSYVLFSRATAAAVGSRVQEIEINASSSKYQTAVGSSRSDDSSSVPSNGWDFKIFY